MGETKTGSEQHKDRPAKNQPLRMHLEFWIQGPGKHVTNDFMDPQITNQNDSIIK